MENRLQELLKGLPVYQHDASLQLHVVKDCQQEGI